MFCAININHFNLHLFMKENNGVLPPVQFDLH